MELSFSQPRSAAEWEAMYDLRYRVLRAPWGQPRGSERAPDDTAPATCTVLAFTPEGRLVATGRLHSVAEGEGQLRFMAVEPDLQRQGVGQRLLNALEAAARQRGLRRLRLDAREAAVPFYERAGYHVVAPGHLLFGLIPHWQMVKDLLVSGH